MTSDIGMFARERPLRASSVDFTRHRRSRMPQLIDAELSPPRDPATISEIDGVVKFGDIKRGKRDIFIQPEAGAGIRSPMRYAPQLPALFR